MAVQAHVCWWLCQLSHPWQLPHCGVPLGRLTGCHWSSPQQAARTALCLGLPHGQVLACLAVEAVVAGQPLQARLTLLCLWSGQVPAGQPD